MAIVHGLLILRFTDFQQKKQSPVNIKVSETAKVKYAPLHWSGYERYPATILATNNGETIRLNVKYSKGKAPAMLSGGPLKRRYRFEQLHFHWGMENSRGSEHTINNISFPMEIHALHIREDLTTEKAMNYLDGFSVVGYLVELRKDNSAIEKILNQMDSIIKRGTYVLDEVFSLDEILIPFESKYFHYEGSLTTSPYSEAVQWFIASRHVSISQKQIDLFRSIASKNEQMQNNFRKTHPLNRRIISLAEP